MRLASSATFAAVMALASVAAADSYFGYNSGATMRDRAAKTKADFAAEMKTASALSGAPGKFNVCRLYTNIQAYTEANPEPSSAFEAAMETDTKLLLGIWTSGTTTIQPELDALKKAIDRYGERFTKLVIGISVGSEDLYRNSVTGKKNKSDVGLDVGPLLEYIKQCRDFVKDTELAKTPIGHVDTWDAWSNSTNAEVCEAVDFFGVDEYPYYESDKENDIDNARTLFDNAFGAVEKVTGGKPIWITETGWPVSGPVKGQGIASPENARKFWVEVGCKKLFGEYHTFWYTIRDSNAANEEQFSIVDEFGTPRFNLTCPTISDEKKDDKNDQKDDKDDKKDDQKGDPKDDQKDDKKDDQKDDQKDDKKDDQKDDKKDDQKDDKKDDQKDDKKDDKDNKKDDQKGETSNSPDPNQRMSSSDSHKMVASSSLAAAIAIAGAFFLL